MTHRSPDQQSAGTSAGIWVTRSTVSGSQLTSVCGSDNRVINTNQPEDVSDDAALAEARRDLATQLAEIRKLLLENRDPARVTDREDAIEAVTALHAELGEQVMADRKTLRQRVKAVAGALRPVADIIGGIAALEAVVRGL